MKAKSIDLLQRFFMWLPLAHTHSYQAELSLLASLLMGYLFHLD